MRRDVLRLFVARRKLDGLGYIVDYGFVDDERLSIGSRTRRATAQEHPAEELGHVPQGSTLEEWKLLAVDMLIFLQLRIERFSKGDVKRRTKFQDRLQQTLEFLRAWQIFTFLSSNFYEDAAFYKDLKLLAIAKCCWIGEFFYGRCISTKTQDTTRALNFTKSSVPCLCRVLRKSPRFYRSAEPREHCESPQIPELPNIRKSANLSKFSAFLRTLAVTETLRNLRHFRNCSPLANFPRSRDFSRSKKISRDLCSCARSLDISVSP